ncbi:MAG: hypothetical protein S4CHLAM7_02080 [Chlamydiae bacterium]|nr:hypothetical protein [Chlamydiota bacterium]
MVSNYSINNYNTCNSLTDVFPQEVVSYSQTICQEMGQSFFSNINYSHYGFSDKSVNSCLIDISRLFSSNSSSLFIPATLINLGTKLVPNNFEKIVSRLIALPILEAFFQTLCVFNGSPSSYPIEYPQAIESPSLKSKREECFSKYSLKLWEKENELPHFEFGSLNPSVANTVNFYLRVVREITDEETDVDLKFIEALISDNIRIHSKIKQPAVQLLIARKKLMGSRSIKAHLLSTRMKVALLNLVAETAPNDHKFLIERLPISSTKISLLLSKANANALLGNSLRYDPDIYVHNLKVLSEFEDLSSLKFEESIALFDILTQNPTLFDAKLFEKTYKALVSNEKSHEISLIDFLNKAYKKNNWEAFDLLLNWIGTVDGIENLYTIHTCLASKKISPQSIQELQDQLARKSEKKIEPSGWYEYATSWLPNFIKC